ncbi:hypothetical protein P153DRAFT_390448 [Dothidotthia symphoricarpi CBS 119687]|uniref:Uncharacterized protein n=1 Tax=Dothidotthia symphoricarpi CBS 119687 TaxID=1392245 RepID=A0A6A6A0B8_9PLEO|nr:uncharacterized protein P153DRAFT_390448 [Dothidotthia symphoricarpi CBS 119687]KAF2124407.1 hypothetical protein P153DRAFT_390448 [Dothidotthia symphoricarpi CBS 119687]
MNDNVAVSFAQARWMFRAPKTAGAAIDVALWPPYARRRHIFSDTDVDFAVISRWSMEIHNSLMQKCQVCVNALLIADSDLEHIRRSRTCADREYAARRAVLGSAVAGDEQAFSARLRGLAALRLEKKRMDELSLETQRTVEKLRKKLVDLDREQVKHGELEIMLWA